MVWAAVLKQWNPFKGKCSAAFFCGFNTGYNLISEVNLILHHCACQCSHSVIHGQYVDDIFPTESRLQKDDDDETESRRRRREGCCDNNFSVTGAPPPPPPEAVKLQCHSLEKSVDIGWWLWLCCSLPLLRIKDIFIFFIWPRFSQHCRQRFVAVAWLKARSQTYRETSSHGVTAAR